MPLFCSAMRAASCQRPALARARAPSASRMVHSHWVIS